MEVNWVCRGTFQKVEEPGMKKRKKRLPVRRPATSAWNSDAFHALYNKQARRLLYLLERQELNELKAKESSGSEVSH
jgi:hypothetical protein